MRIGIDDLDKAVRDELEAYAAEVQESIDAAVVRVARRCLAQIRRNSPKKSGKYRKGWTMATQKGRLSATAVIYNKTRYFLIHLLENGYQKANGGRVNGTPHVEPAAEEAQRELVEEITKSIKEL